MFGKEAESTTGQGSLNSIFGQGCKVKGDIELQGTIRIDGQFDGSMQCPETLIIGKSGVVKADIVASNKIELQTGSHVEGDIQTARLVIDEGVFFEGNCKMGGKQPTDTKPEKSWTKPEQKAEAAATR
jgi:cytoskeletal protein CcmA (bactofilin family)